jgi:NosR/NirI family nitrous oxide reductase transcriptional regulator
MMRWFGFLSSLVVLFAFDAGLSFASTYDAPLPAKLSSDPDMCAYAPCRDVMPAADGFSPRMGKPSYVEAYRTENGQKKKVGYVFLSTDIVDIPAYSGKPVVTLIGMDTKGVITGIRILKHSEPILLIGIPESELIKFAAQYVGRFAGDKVEIGKTHTSEGAIGVDAISGATVTVIAENQVIMTCAHEIAKQVGIIKAVDRPQAKLAPSQGPRNWDTLVKDGSIQHLVIQPAEVGLPNTGVPYLDIYFGYLNAPTIGESILGKADYERLMAELKPSEHVLFVIANGSGSFKGSGFVRGGIFDRIQVAQELDTFTFRDTDYQNLYGIKAAGAPSYKEAGIFIVRGKSFSAAYPWNLVILGNKENKETREKTFVSFPQEYWLPGEYMVGGRPHYERPEPTWIRVWRAKKLEIASFVLLLLSAALVYSQRDKLVRRANHKDKRWVLVPKYFFWITSLGFVGYYSMAQPSITHVMTWFHSIIFQWKWELFLSDPLIFIFWWFIIITVFIWGRGLFCGWLCPYGALAELVHRVARMIGLKRLQFSLPKPLHDKLKWTKYLIFGGLVATSFYSMGMAEKLAEVEPFKTTFLVGVLHRSWPFILFWTALFGLSIFVERPFCKYVCPLGAGLAIPSTFRFFGLKRKAECQTCHACANGCASLAIDREGRIDQRECLLCLDCMVLYYDDHACPPLSQERRKRNKAGQPLTPIGPNGYFIPIKEVK